MSRLKKLVRSLQDRKSYKSENKLISPLAYFDSSCIFEKNIYIDRFCVLHNTKISSYSYIGYGCKFNNVEIGRYTSLASDIKIGLGKHPIHLLSSSPLFYSDKNPFRINLKNKLSFDDSSKKTTIGNDVWIGANVIIMDGVKIGDGAIIGAGSVVTKDVEEFSIVVGAPAKKIKYRFEKEEIETIKKSKWWNYSPEIVSTMDIYQKYIG